MTVWVDGDGCPIALRPILCRAGERRQIHVVFVADRALPLPEGTFVRQVTVAQGDGAADEVIAAGVEDNDLVVTRDIPLAARMVEREIAVINDRGTEYTVENIRSRLSESEAMKELRLSGLAPMPSKKQFGNKEVQAFANCFDRVLQRLMKNSR